MKVGVAIAVAGLTGAVALAGRGAPEQIVLKSHSDLARPATTLAAFNPRALGNATRGLHVGADDLLAFERQLNTIRRSDDRIGETLAEVMCSGLTEIADQNRRSDGSVVPPSVREWQDYLKEEVTWYLPSRYGRLISSRVGQFNTTAQLATINPRAAYAYVEVCARGKRG